MATKSNKPHEVTEEERYNWYHGIGTPEEEKKRRAGIMKMLGGRTLGRGKRPYASGIDKEAEQGSKYEALNARGEAKAKADRERKLSLTKA